MAKLYIAKEEVDLEEEFILFEEDQTFAKWYIGPSVAEDYDDKTREFLKDFIDAQAMFPVFLTFEPYEDQRGKIERFLKANGISYYLWYEGVKNKAFPVFKIIVKASHSLHLVLEETFWMAASNQFFAISFLIPSRIRWL